MPVKFAPIVLFVYNRPVHTRKTLESLKANSLADESELFIFSDGPKDNASPEVSAKIKEVRELVREKQWCGTVHIKESSKNLGLANSVINGVTETVNKFGKVIVVEDDLVLSPHFLNYMNDALEIYRDELRVMHVAGYMFPVRGILPETFFYRDTSCWGWATWRRAWEKFEPDADKLLTGLRNNERRRAFDIEGSANYYKMLQMQSTGAIDSWAIRWYASVFLNNGLCLHPGRSLVDNIGHDGTGKHCGQTNVYATQPGKDRITDFTQRVEESEEAVRLMTAFFKSLRKPLYIRVINRLLRMARKTT
jgi:hypothetical protein